MSRIEQAAAAIDAARTMLAGLDGLSLAPDAEVAALLARAAELSRVVDAQRVRLAAEVAERSRGSIDEALCRQLGHRSAKECVGSVFGLRGRQAADLLAIAAATSARPALSGGELPARFPHVAGALADGGLSLAQADAILQSLGPAVPRADERELAWAERALVDAATAPTAPLVPELLAVQGRMYAAVLDPDGVLPGAERQRAMRSLTVGRRADGMWVLTMVSPAEEGSALKAVLDAYEGPRVAVRFRDPDAPAGDDAGDDVPDGRSPAQLRHDVLVGIVREHAASGHAPTVGGEAPTLLITGTIEALTAALDGTEHRERSARVEHTGDVVPVDVAARMLCDAFVQIAVTDGCGHVLELGRAKRLFNRAQRRALAARDHGCQAPGCRMPAAWCEAHHVLPWLLGGPTDVDNGILLCTYHHHEVHAGRLVVERAGPRPGQWRVVSRLQPVRRAARSWAAAEPSSAGSLAAVAVAPLAIRLPDGVGSSVAIEPLRLEPQRIEPRGTVPLSTRLLGDEPQSIEHRARRALARRHRRRAPLPAVDLHRPRVVLRP
ncbi:hypothetical protein ACVWW9_001345 [Agrococcus sp. UYP33]